MLTVIDLLFLKAASVFLFIFLFENELKVTLGYKGSEKKSSGAVNNRVSGL